METDTAARLTAALAGQYRIERELGVGGMATVYLAHDLRHDRPVAVKVLRPELAAAIGNERFLQEIKLTARLQHPHILALFDSGEADGFLYYVMPLVQGESLRARLQREKQLAVADAVRIAREIAGALDYAHRHGVIHRDIKPENVLFQDGQALVADFGIALAIEAAGGPRLTATGFSPGTPLYMSPEQAGGDGDLDARSDVYSLGVVLYEMLAGEPPHAGPTAQAVIASVMADEPRPITARRKTVPPRIAAAIEVALQKLPADRFPSADTFAQALTPDAPWPGAAPAPPPGAMAAWIRDKRSWVAVGVATVAVLAALLRGREASTPSATPARFRLVLPGEDLSTAGDISAPAISPDGTLLVYPGNVRDSAGATRRQLLARPLDQVEPVPIPGTEGGAAPFFSPDNRWIAFWVGPRLVKTPVSGGPPVTLADSTSPFIPAGNWGPDGKIVFPATPNALAEVDETGGTPRVIYQDSTLIVGHPLVLPGGEGMLFLRCRRDVCNQRQEIAILDPATHATRVVAGPGAFRMAATPSAGYLLYVRGSLFVSADVDLFAAPFDVRRGVTGEAVPVVEHVQSFTLSSTGTLVTVGAAPAQNELVVVAPDGSEQPLTEERRQYLFPAVSPDGRRLAAEIHDATGGQIWVYDTSSKTLTRLTTVGHNSRPAWSPDGGRVAYSSARDSASAIYVVPADGSGPEQRIGVSSPRMAFVNLVWMPDGQRIAYAGAGAGGEVFYGVAAAADSVGQPIPGLSPGAGRPAFSPDGRWVAYASDESGRLEIYIHPYPGPGGHWLVSASGGSAPVWAPSGRTLFYLGPDGWLYAATLALKSEVQVTGRKRLFDASPYFQAYDIFPDGQHFVFIREDRRPPEVNITVNWFTELSRRLRAGGQAARSR